MGHMQYLTPEKSVLRGRHWNYTTRNSEGDTCDTVFAFFHNAVCATGSVTEMDFGKWLEEAAAHTDDCKKIGPHCERCWLLNSEEDDMHN